MFLSKIGGPANIKVLYLNLEKALNAIYLHGGIGDCIMHSPLILKIIEKWPLIDWHIYTDKIPVVKFFTGLVPKSDEQYHKDKSLIKFRLDLDTFAVFWGDPPNRRAKDLRDFNLRFINENKLSHYLSIRPVKDNIAAELMVEKGFNRRTLPAAMLGLPPISFKVPKPPRSSLIPGEYITVHDGVDIHHYGAKYPTKTWSAQKWGELNALIKAKYPNLKIVQLGTKKMAKELSGVDYRLMDLPDITDVFKIIAHSKLHIDGESGMVHAAHALGTKAIVLFGPTPINYFGYPDNINIERTFCKPCWWYDDSWTRECPRGYGIPKCMESISAQRVFEEVIKLLK